jgi:hypothetical protein
MPKYLLLRLALRIRWFYFHINPRMIKFRMSGDEFHFIHRRSGHLYSNYSVKEANDENN